MELVFIQVAFRRKKARHLHFLCPGVPHHMDGALLKQHRAPFPYRLHHPVHIHLSFARNKINEFFPVRMAVGRLNGAPGLDAHDAAGQQIARKPAVSVHDPPEEPSGYGDFFHVVFMNDFHSYPPFSGRFLSFLIYY
ncbi:hypothetical protein SDC9_199341 [bioreactor metagenome]|uniref:Uncharacterized protein n=1 Tax=bioreactor metagenome TaxID=1076179 RepID=A0A645ILI5_9ZZZZ